MFVLLDVLFDLYPSYYHMIDLIQIDLIPKPRKTRKGINFQNERSCVTDRDGREGNFKIDGAWVNRGAGEPIRIFLEK